MSDVSIEFARTYSYVPKFLPRSLETWMLAEDRRFQLEFPPPRLPPREKPSARAFSNQPSRTFPPTLSLFPSTLIWFSHSLHISLGPFRNLRPLAYSRSPLYHLFHPLWEIRPLSPSLVIVLLTFSSFALGYLEGILSVFVSPTPILYPCHADSRLLLSRFPPFSTGPWSNPPPCTTDYPLPALQQEREKWAFRFFLFFSRTLVGQARKIP